MKIFLFLVLLVLVGLVSCQVDWDSSNNNNDNSNIQARVMHQQQFQPIRVPINRQQLLNNNNINSINQRQGLAVEGDRDDELPNILNLPLSQVLSRLSLAQQQELLSKLSAYMSSIKDMRSQQGVRVPNDFSVQQWRWHGRRGHHDDRDGHDRWDGDDFDGRDWRRRRWWWFNKFHDEDDHDSRDARDRVVWF